MKLREMVRNWGRISLLPALPLTGVLLLGISPVYAESVFLIQEKPEPAALARILFPERAIAQPEKPKFKLRGIRFPDDDASAGSVSESGADSDSVTGTAVGFNIQFALNSPELSPETLPYLDAVGEMLLLEEAQSAKLTIAGHADASGDSAHNLSLSQARAVAVADYIKSKFAVAGDRLYTRGYGESTPLPHLNPYDAMNRRVEFHPVP